MTHSFMVIFQITSHSPHSSSSIFDVGDRQSMTRWDQPKISQHIYMLAVQLLGIPYKSESKSIRYTNESWHFCSRLVESQYTYEAGAKLFLVDKLMLAAVRRRFGR